MTPDVLTAAIGSAAVVTTLRIKSLLVTLERDVLFQDTTKAAGDAGNFSGALVTASGDSPEKCIFFAAKCIC
jgi:hypothetical protein